ncbi:MAG TPA: thiolase family protein [Thermohalobaculum sp.]|nr:thiolase family protein [Thermohalobaculum sp.]
MTHVRGTAVTAFGRLEGSTTLSLMGDAAATALDDSGLERGAIDGLVTGYSTTMPHLMLSTVFAEAFGLRPAYAHSVQLGGATGAAMLMLGDLLVRSGEARNVLIVAGENRLSGQGRSGAIQALAQVGHPTAEVPLGATVPAYYALAASRYLHETGARERDLAELAVLMRRHATDTGGAHLAAPVTLAEVMASKPIASPLKLLDCCPISDGAAAVVLAAEAANGPAVRIAGAAQAHTHQHVSEAPDDIAAGARIASARALERAGIGLADIGYLAVYDSFTVTLALLLEALGISAPGAAGADARAGRFGRAGPLPLNTHGGLLSYGHCGVAGAMAHFVEAVRQMTGRCGARQVPGAPAHALYHGDGGVLSSHASLVLERTR